MARLDRMDELRRGARRGEGRGNFPRDMAALTQSRDDNAPARCSAGIDSGFECSVKAFGEAFEPGDFSTDHPPGDGEIDALRCLENRLLGQQNVAHSVRMTRSFGRIDTTPPPQGVRLMREDVLLRPALKIKHDAMRQKIEAGASELLASLARQYRVEFAAQRVQVEHVRSGITKLLF